MKLNEIIKHNQYYKQKQSEVNKLYKELKEINKQIDLDEIMVLPYIEVKGIVEMIKYCIDDEHKLKAIQEIMSEKKLEEYPQIQGVHYYEEINKIDFISKEEKVKIDTHIKEATYNMNRLCELDKLPILVLDYLMKNGVLEKEYRFRCNCNSFECSEKIISQKKYEELKNYWAKKWDTTEEEDEEFGYGNISISCWNDGFYEIDNEKDFLEKCYIRYKVIKKPDMTLDEM